MQPLPARHRDPARTARFQRLLTELFQQCAERTGIGASVKAINIMSDETAEIAGDGQPQPTRKKMSGKKLVLLVVLPLLVVLAGGGAGAAYFLGLFGGGTEQAAEEKPKAPKPTVFFDLPEILVNLNATGRQASYLKLRVALEIDDPEQVKTFEKMLPRVLDSFQTYLRELRPDELQGSAGLFRLKEELLVRVNAAVQPVKVNDVLFKEMLLQ